MEDLDGVRRVADLDLLANQLRHETCRSALVVIGSRDRAQCQDVRAVGSSAAAPGGLLR